MKASKLRIPIIVVLIIAGIYVFQQQINNKKINQRNSTLAEKSDTTKWQTYIDHGNNFSIAYPSKWTAGKDAASNEIYLTPEAPSTKTNDSPWPTTGILISVGDNLEEYTSMEIALESQEEYPQTLKTFRIEGADATIFEDVADSGKEISPALYMVKNGKIIVFLSRIDDAQNNLIRRILRTVKLSD